VATPLAVLKFAVGGPLLPVFVKKAALPARAPATGSSTTSSSTPTAPSGSTSVPAALKAGQG
jgi:hypothetical protein